MVEIILINGWIAKEQICKIALIILCKSENLHNWYKHDYFTTTFILEKP